MAYEVGEFAISGRAASNINAGMPITLVGAVTPGSALNDVYQHATLAKLIVGVARATALAGKAVDVQIHGVVKVKAGASVGPGQPIGPVSGGSNPALLTLGSVPVAGVGISLTGGAAGEFISVLLRPGTFTL